MRIGLFKNKELNPDEEIISQEYTICIRFTLFLNLKNLFISCKNINKAPIYKSDGWYKDGDWIENDKVVPGDTPEELFKNIIERKECYLFHAKSPVPPISVVKDLTNYLEGKIVKFQFWENINIPRIFYSKNLQLDKELFRSMSDEEIKHCKTLLSTYTCKDPIETRDIENFSELDYISKVIGDAKNKFWVDWYKFFFELCKESSEYKEFLEWLN